MKNVKYTKRGELFIDGVRVQMFDLVKDKNLGRIHTIGSYNIFTGMVTLNPIHWDDKDYFFDDYCYDIAGVSNQKIVPANQICAIDKDTYLPRVNKVKCSLCGHTSRSYYMVGEIIDNKTSEKYEIDSYVKINESGYSNLDKVIGKFMIKNDTSHSVTLLQGDTICTKCGAGVECF